jgi:hypothetical protein
VNCRWAGTPLLVSSSIVPMKLVLTILEEFLRKPEAIESKKDTELRCLACGSPVGNRSSCPACSWSYEGTRRCHFQQ